MTATSLLVSDELRAGYRRFIGACEQGGEYRLTPVADASPYALCFAIFGLRLLLDTTSLDAGRERWHRQLLDGLNQMRAARAAQTVLGRDKPYLQLLSFTLSALSALGTLGRDPLADHVLPLLPHDIGAELTGAGVFEGRARSGNHAMFMGILLMHAQRHLARDTAADIEKWVSLHRAHMNRFGFWGAASSMSHLQFQNGYHQYELFDYLDLNLPEWLTAADNTAGLADSEGHFAPYPGGGGCFDYDAVFLLTGEHVPVQRHAELLARLAATISREQNADGGFGESQRIRPRSFDNLRRAALHVLRGAGLARTERARLMFSLLRPVHDRMHTHWSRYSRGWGESDLWDSWFRVLTLARIEVAFDAARAARWGFIDFPGIGYHHSLRSASG